MGVIVPSPHVKVKRIYVSKKDEPKNSVFVSSKITSQIMTIGGGFV